MSREELEQIRQARLILNRQADRDLQRLIDEGYIQAAWEFTQKGNPK